MDNDLYEDAKKRMAKELGVELEQPVATQQTTEPQQEASASGKGGGLTDILTPAANLWKSVGGGMLKAGFETSDLRRAH